MSSYLYSGDVERENGEALLAVHPLVLFFFFFSFLSLFKIKLKLCGLVVVPLRLDTD